ncbi:hypothetical protein C1X72_07725 [Pseudomonas sp. FW306-2-2C-D06B]|uniref:hypothetical protein n=1 Tax=unclassified Pseudomonas TaxID=196821 RepID=UPI000C88627D|nr:MULTISPECIES: hypothetical protein [unclassified Pseudomonas]PMY81876.1 hypothetical protein C1X72_07725 [Pseudomonas sp. FW306-2-2C-D06B]
MTIEELAAARVDFAEGVAKALERMMFEFRTKTGVAIRELDIQTISQNYMDGRVECLIGQVDVQLDLQVRPANKAGATTQITFS